MIITTREFILLDKIYENCLRSRKGVSGVSTDDRPITVALEDHHLIEKEYLGGSAGSYVYWITELGKQTLKNNLTRQESINS